MSTAEPINLEFTVLVDNREQGPWDFHNLKADADKKYAPLIVPTKTVMLPTGDYQIEDFRRGIVIERKSIADLFLTLGRGRDRFRAEVERMEEFDRAYVICEASWQDITTNPPAWSRVPAKTIHRTVTSWSIKFPWVRWMMCDNRRLAEITAFRLMEKWWHQRHDVKPQPPSDRLFPPVRASSMKPRPKKSSGFYKPIKWHGGKEYLAPKIVAMMPPHTHYVEPCAGGLAVLLAKDPDGVSEVANDINGHVTNFWSVVQDPEKVRELECKVTVTPFSEAEFTGAGLELGSDVDRAAAFFIRNRMPRQGLMKEFATLSRSRTRSGMNEQVSSYLGAIHGLPQVCARLRRVVILNRDAVDAIKSQDSPKTLFYVDPPYLHSTRVTTKDYAYEMTVDDHQRLLETLLRCKGSVMISGYPSELYDKLLADWHRVEFDIDNKASGKKTKEIKTEVVWMNFEPEEPKQDGRSKTNRIAV